MRKPLRTVPCVAAFLFALLPAFVQGQQADAPAFTPEVGQHGKDVVWVPTPDALVDKMLEMAKTGPSDFVIDLGSGDGRIAIAAAKKFGARSLGIEYDGEMVALSRRKAAEAGVDRAAFEQADLFQTDLSRATVITMYLLPGLNIRLRPALLALKPGTRIVSHRFNLGDWDPDATQWVDGRQAHLWIVPADVRGDWKMTVQGPKGPVSYALRLRQEYQRVEGEVGRMRAAKLFEGVIVGDTLAFSMEDAGTTRRFTGRVNGPEISGTIVSTGLPSFNWSATR
jgi:SAM-dependent methyltransferase